MINVIPKIGIMQGRLSESINNKIQSFPHNTWKNEFQKAHDCGFQVLEWVFDDIKNPIMENSKIDEIISLSKKFNIAINSVCADYFMNEKLFNVTNSELDENLTILKNLMTQCTKIGIKMVEIPLVDSSSLKTKEDLNEFVQNLTLFLSQQKSNVIINLETDLPPIEFKKLLERFKKFKVFANYDTGNSSSLGYLANEEISLLHPWLKNIHIKDRLFKGDTVHLGNGDADFNLFFQSLSKIDYSGDLIIQGARDLSNRSTDPINLCMNYYEFVNQYIDEYLR